MISRSQIAGCLGAATFALHPCLASAQEGACISEEEVSSMAIYAMPGLVQSMHITCGASLAPDGFLATEGDSMAGRYAALQDAAWPQAKSGIMKFAGARAKKKSAELDILAQLPDNAVRPLLEAMLVQEVSAKIAQKDCRKAERAMEAIAPIEPETAGNLIGVVIGIAGVQNPPVCAVDPT
jgi:hypothetical protein